MNNLLDLPLPISVSEEDQPKPRTLEDLLAHLQERTDLSDENKARYASAIKRAGFIRNKPLSSIQASLDLVEITFPLDGFDPSRWATPEAYRQFRRRLQAALKDFLGVYKALEEARAQQDGWYHLLDALDCHAPDIPELDAYRKTNFVAVRSLADFMRTENVQPQAITGDIANRLYLKCPTRMRDSYRRAMAFLDKLREYDFARPHLPLGSIDFSASRLRQQQEPIPPHWQEDFEAIYAVLADEDFDPIDKEFAGRSPETQTLFNSTMNSITRTYLNVHPETDTSQPWDLIFTRGDVITEMCNLMVARCQLPAGDNRKIQPRTARKYLNKYKRVLHELDADPNALKEFTKALKNNPILIEGKDAEEEMAEANKRFCENLFESTPLTKRFFNSPFAFQDAAMEMETVASAQGRPLTKNELVTYRWLGTCAAFCAIEIGGAPIRCENAMGLTLHGTDAHIMMPKSKKDPIKLRIPPGKVKNKKGIKVEIHPGKQDYLGVLNWYLETIRPLYQHAANNPYFFPAPESATKPMDESYFSERYSLYTRTVLNLPMTPQQMRHGQASLLLRAHPEKIVVIAKRLGDTVNTVLTYYAWIEEVEQMQAGQELIAEMIDE
ncbi:site-specific integrase [Cohaesibacter intestini]|uniref:site-specific integrase n=1 Tax=Cohaesibacter intestini TaxID=2211145 RepID=UPI000DE975DF|nr:site-specific integrase [Cohaesibacter intestini]